MKKALITLMLFATLVATLGTTAFANNTKLVALTFDDGPSRTHTPPLLAGLAQRDIRATFFLVGTAVEKNPTIVEKIFEGGHELANHSYSHPWFSKMTLKQINGEILSCNSLLSDISGCSNHLLRVPYGSISKNVRLVANAPLIQWSVDPTNGRNDATEDGMYANLIKTVKDGSIILLHDTSKKNLNVAFRAIDTLLTQGYEFVTVSELFRLRGITPENGKEYFNLPPSSKETQFDETNLSAHWAADYIRLVSEKEIMEGDQNIFLPNAYMTRAMAMTIIWRMAGCPATSQQTLSTPLLEAPNATAEDNLDFSPPPTTAPTKRFTDVPSDKWYSQAIDWAAERGYAQGISETLFAPDNTLTKEEFYTFLARANKETLSCISTDEAAAYRDDVHISKWAKDSVMAFRNSGFKSKNDPQVFRPLDFITRAEAAELISFIITNS